MTIISTRFYGVMVSTLDFESSDPSSNLGRTYFFNRNISKFTQKHSRKSSPNVGLEPTTLRLRVWCSTDWASRADVEYRYFTESDQRLAGSLLQWNHARFPFCRPGLDSWAMQLIFFNLTLKVCVGGYLRIENEPSAKCFTEISQHIWPVFWLFSRTSFLNQPKAQLG